MPEHTEVNSSESLTYIDEIDLSDLFGRFARHKVLIATVTALVFLVGLTLTLLAQPSHLARATILPPEYQDLVTVMEYGDIDLTPQGAFKFSLFKMGQAELQIESLEAQSGLLTPEERAENKFPARFARKFGVSEELESGRLIAATVSFSHTNPDYAIAVIEDLIQRADAAAQTSVRLKYDAVLVSRINFLDRKLQQAARTLTAPTGGDSVPGPNNLLAQEQNLSALALEQITISARLERDTLVAARSADMQALRMFVYTQATLVQDKRNRRMKAIMVAGYFVLGLASGCLVALLLDAHARRVKST